MTEVTEPALCTCRFGFPWDRCCSGNSWLLAAFLLQWPGR